MERFSARPPSSKALRSARANLPDSAPDVIARYIARQRREFLRSGKAIRREGGAEALHDLRVASRRLRAALALLPEETTSKAQNKVRKSLRRVGRVLGAPRESDVNVAILERRKSASEPSLTLSLELLLGFEYERRSRQRAEMERRLRKIDLEEIARRLSPSAGRRGEARWLLPLDRFAAHHLDPAGRALEKLWDRASARPSEPALHALRIAIKKHRYMLEILSPALAPRKGASALSRLRALQDELGELHDQAVLQGEIVRRRRFFEGLGLASLSEAMRPVEASLARELRARRAAAVKRLREAKEGGFLADLSADILR